MSRNDRRNVRARETAERIISITALDITDALENLNREHAEALNGRPKGEQSDRRSAGGHSDPAGDIATERYRIGLMIEDLRDAVAEGVAKWDAIARMASGGKRVRAFASELDPFTPGAQGVKRCGDNQRSTDTRRAPDGVLEWGRQECQELPTKAGLCHACYMRRYRWATAHDQPMTDLGQGENQ